MQSLAEIDAELGELLSAQTGYGESLTDYIARMSPRFGPPGWTRTIASMLDAARHKRQMNCLSVPPRHGKTFTAQHAIAKWTKDAPADTNAYASYNSDLAHSKSRTIRELAQRDGVELAKDMRNLGEWRTTAGGGLLAGGVGGGWSGHGVSGLFGVDDPHKDRADADSAHKRQLIFEWFNSAAFTRSEGSSFLVIQTRWHEDDLIGKLSKLPGWNVINIPAIAEDDDLLGRKQGEALWPEVYPLEELERIRAQIGEYEFASLYQGQPRPRGDKVFKEVYYYDPTSLDLTGCRIVIGVDPAASTKTTADYSVAVVLAVRGRGRDRECYVLNVLRKQMQVPDFVDQLAALQRGSFNAPCVVESAGGFKAVPQMLLRLNPTLRVIEVPPRGDKFQRAQPVAAAWNRGKVLVPFAAPWLPDFLEELDKFTGVKDAHDDQVDALAHAFNAFAYARKPPRRGARAEPGRWVGH